MAKNTPITNPLVKDRFLRVNDVLAVFPVSRATWWAGVAEGRYPKGIKLSPRTTAWRASEIEALIDRLSTEAQA
ncbi:helix-turn-helix transcriptional regulator [Desulfomicrobium escambiense]|uniref:helix-turn-helix transcriptional regulator n=1 Tax=Desulfomicrobium escambiense TaxID=29503 RepID=UPI00048FD96A|nr:AlpA family phage regulatory protein [Desulfomicrobium escambiense]